MEGGGCAPIEVAPRRNASRLERAGKVVERSALRESGAMQLEMLMMVKRRSSVFQRKTWRSRASMRAIENSDDDELIKPRPRAGS